MHPARYEDYISCRYVLDGCRGELTPEEQESVEECFRGKYGYLIART